MSLVVIIGLVLAISGSAYTAIAAMRDHWGERIAECRKAYKFSCEELGNAKNPKVKKGYAKHKEIYDKKIAIWENSRWIPIILLGGISILISVDVILFDWTTSEADLFSVRHRFWPNLYKAVLVIVTLVDGYALARTFFCYAEIRDASEELERLYAINVNLRTKKEVASTKTVGQVQSALDKQSGAQLSKKQ